MYITDAVIDNSRFTSVEFEVDKTAVLHGFAGYFHTRLYGNVDLSRFLNYFYSLLSTKKPNEPHHEKTNIVVSEQG